MYKIICALFLCLSSLLKAQEPVLVVGTNGEFPPFSYIENRTLVGFDIDVAKEVCKRLGKTIQFKDMPFESLIPDLLLCHVDFVAAGMSYTEKRAERVFFTRPYLDGDQLVVFSASEKSLDFEALKGKTVVVVEGFTADSLISSKEGVDLVRLSSQGDCFMAVKSGRADAFVTAKSTVDAFFEVQDASLFHLAEIEGTGDTCALVVPKSKPEMLQAVQKALDSMEEDGTMTSLKTQWKLK